MSQLQTFRDVQNLIERAVILPLEPEAVPTYGRRATQPSKLDPHKPFLQERLTAGVWNAQVLLREIRQRMAN